MPVLALDALTPNQWTVKVQDALSSIFHVTVNSARRKFLGIYRQYICRLTYETDLLAILLGSCNLDQILTYFILVDLDIFRN